VELQGSCEAVGPLYSSDVNIGIVVARTFAEEAYKSKQPLGRS